MEITSIAAERVLTRAELLMNGLTPWQLRRALAEGRLIRLRRDRYVSASSAMDAQAGEAVRVGGRLACVSLLALLEVFVRSSSVLHVHVARNASRHRVPSGAVPMRLHWQRLVAEPASRHAVSIADAVRCGILCQTPRDAVATLDSVLHQGLMRWDELHALVRTLPARYGVLMSLTDARAESGTESLVRLMLRHLGADVDVQVQIPTVGRVDLVVDGWLIVECDSREFHEGWERQRADRRRDIAAARLGYTTIRPLAEDVLYAPDELFQALAAVVAHGSPARR